MKKTGGEIIVDYLIKEGIEYIFGITGHGCMGLTDALRDREEKGLIKHIQVKQEMCGVHMADGYFRVSGKPLVMFTSIGPGALNTAIGLAASYVDSTSVIVITGDAHTHMQGCGLLQEVERKSDGGILSCLEPVSKRVWRVETIMQLQKVLHRAFNVSTTGRKGPVVISVPMDIQCATLDLDFMNSGVRRTQAKMYGDPEYIRRAYDVMKKARRPVILAGGGYRYNGDTNKLVKLAEKWGAAVVTTLQGKSAFPERHPQYAFHGGSKGTDVGNYICRTADVILSLGCRFADESTSSYRKDATFNFPDTKLIHVDIDTAEIGKNYPVDVGIVGDVDAVVSQLYYEFEVNGSINDSSFSSYMKDLSKQKKKWFNKIVKRQAKTKGRLTISQILGIINKVFPKDGIIITSSGNSQAQLLQEYVFETPKTNITSGGLSCMGFSFPAAMGVKLAKPEIAVMALVGDGDFMMTMQEMSTAVQFGINLIVLLVNNCGWLAVNDLQMGAYGKEYGYGNLWKAQDGSIGKYSPDFSQIAKSFGMKSFKVTKFDEVEVALKKALTTNKPMLIEAMVSNVYPDSGSDATGWWDVPVPHYLEDKHEAYLKGKSEEI